MRTSCFLTTTDTQSPIHIAVGSIIGGSVQEMQQLPISPYDRHKALSGLILQAEQVSNPVCCTACKTAFAPHAAPVEKPVFVVI
jgi:hypothetical protein